MSDLDDKQPEMAEALNKMTRYNKNVKTLIDLMNKAIEKLDVLVKNKSSENNDADAEKERIDKIFEKKAVGRPRGSYSEKQKQYLKMLNEEKVKMPKSQTLEFYKIIKDGEVYKLMDG
mgnify:CR=1 FL=1|jgi:DNA-directed RNA polymerase